MNNYKEEIAKRMEDSARRMGINVNTSDNSTLTPEWFREKAKNFPALDAEANKYLKKFNDRFSPDVLANLQGKELLYYIFLNSENKTNLCYTLEFDPDCRKIFGSIKSGTAYKYGLHYSKKNKSWATGTSNNPKFISEQDAIILGTNIRDCLLNGYTTIEENIKKNSIDDYVALNEELENATNGYTDRVWFVKYYAMLFPELFPPIYSHNAQYKVIDKLKLSVDYDNKVARIGVIRDFVKKCEISNVMFSRVFWTFCDNDDVIDSDPLETDDIEDNMENEYKNCLEIKLNKRKDKTNPLNLIVYGAPGTGKTYNMPIYAYNIIKGEKYDKVQNDRSLILEEYKNLVKKGQIVFTTFHQNYGYEDFIQGLRPNPNSETLSFKIVDGIFKKIVDRALNDADNKYVIIIDEINRANISKVFGELITLIEDDKRWGEDNEMSATLPSGAPFAVPNNLYIVGTMNSADKSISLIDAALRRRFSFDEMIPNVDLIKDNDVKAAFEKMNTELMNELESSDLLIGHSYFIGITKKEFKDVMNKKIIPLLYEYFYDDRSKVYNFLEKTLNEIKFKPEKTPMGRITIVEK